MTMFVSAIALVLSGLAWGVQRTMSNCLFFNLMLLGFVASATSSFLNPMFALLIVTASVLLVAVDFRRKSR